MDRAPVRCRERWRCYGMGRVAPPDLPGPWPSSPGWLTASGERRVRRRTRRRGRAMISIQQALDMAWKHYQAGNLRQAEQLYQQILQVDPNQVDALHLLGLI